MRACTRACRYPELSGRRLYLAGESYGGVYVPRLAEALLEVQRGGGRGSGSGSGRERATSSMVAGGGRGAADEPIDFVLEVGAAGGMPARAEWMQTVFACCLGEMCGAHALALLALGSGCGCAC